MKRYIRSSDTSVNVDDYKMLSSTLKEGGDTFAIFRKTENGSTKWAAAKYNENGDLDKAFEITYDQARGFKPLGRLGEISRKLGKKILPNKSDVKESCKVKSSIQSSHYTYTGEPDPSGEFEGNARFMNQFKHWTDVYRYWSDNIFEKYGVDEPEKIENEVDKFYEKYKDYDVVKKAYEKWTETISMDDYENNLNSSCIESGCSSKKYTKSSCIESSDNSGENAYVIEYAFDDGNAEDGPIIHEGKDLMFATSEEEAVQKWIDEYLDPSDTSFAGASAHLATDQEVNDLIGMEW